jgi:O-antigen/teichoic acid export membrane protein
MKIVWPNAKKTGIISLGAWLINRSSILISSYFFGLTITSQLGLSLQLLNFVGGLSSLLFYSYQPEITSLIATNKYERLRILVSRTIILQWISSFFGILIVVFIGPVLLEGIGSNASLLPQNLLLIFGLILFLEWNHSTFTSLISLENKIPFLWASIISGFAILLLSLLISLFFNFGILSIILSQGLIQLIFNNWYWPKYYLKKNNLSYLNMIKYFYNDILHFFKGYLVKKVIK